MSQAKGSAKRPAGGWRWPALGLLFAAAPLLFWKGALVDVEALGLLRKNWSERSILLKIFDVHGWDFYRGRELSYLIDFLDARWVGHLLANDVVFFVAPSAVLASLALLLIAHRLAPRALPDLGATTRWLCVLVLLSNFVFLSTMGMLYRATKPLVTPLLLGLLLLVLAEFRRPRLGPRAAASAVFVPALLMSLLDRQGLFYVLLLVLVLAFAWGRTRRGGALLLGAGASVAAWLAYNELFGPWIIQAVAGYRPDMGFQRMGPSALLQVQPWVTALGVLGDWTSVLLGGLPPALLAGVGVAVTAAWTWREREHPRRLALTVSIALLAVAAQVAMVAIMVQRHPPVAWVGNRLWYYPLPYQALLAFGLLWGVDRLGARPGRPFGRVVPVALAALVLGNVARWPEMRVRMHEAPAFSEQMRRSTLLARSLRGAWADPLLDGDYRRFYFDCLDRFPALSARALPQVSEGRGVDMSRLRDGRVAAWAGRDSQIVPRATTSGRYVLAGSVLLRPGDHLRLLLGGKRLLAEVRREGPGEGVEFFRLETHLEAGLTDLRLQSRLPEKPVDGLKREQAGFALLLPLALWPVSAPGHPLPAVRNNPS